MKLNWNEDDDKSPRRIKVEWNEIHLLFSWRTWSQRQCIAITVNIFCRLSLFYTFLNHAKLFCPTYSGYQYYAGKCRRVFAFFTTPKMPHIPRLDVSDAQQSPQDDEPAVQAQQ